MFLQSKDHLPHPFEPLIVAAFVVYAINGFGNTSVNLLPQDVANSADVASVRDPERGSKKGMAVVGKINITPLEEKSVDDEPLVYASKQEAKIAFKELLESVNVEPNWAMRVIVNDKRYATLRTLGEKKKAFNEVSLQNDGSSFSFSSTLLFVSRHQ
ncbi:hypothetical protein IFM89_034748 [Coptis chinensis]|uniref:FF domain-containing protein n=1 Tax=Coptis chinensis TaxID=261450 RepID=A0A835H9A4_9MAGN|nr:hypothetical protein IFM89_034748 [Coptis chinensis]